MLNSKETRKLVGKPLVACDLDGTILGPGDRGLDEAKRAAMLCRERGALFTIATGRVCGASQKYVDILELSIPYITNGGAVIAYPNGEVIRESAIPEDLARIASHLLREIGHPFYYLGAHRIVTEWSGPETTSYARGISFGIDVVQDVNLAMPSPCGIAVRLSPEVAERTVEELRVILGPEVSVLLSLPHLIEIKAAGVSKGAALKELGQRLGVDERNILAVGDSLNDLDMLLAVGLRACVGNAVETVKRTCEFVSSRSYGAGVLEIVEKFIPG